MPSAVLPSLRIPSSPGSPRPSPAPPWVPVPLARPQPVPTPHACPVTPSAALSPSPWLRAAVEAERNRTALGGGCVCGGRWVGWGGAGGPARGSDTRVSACAAGMCADAAVRVTRRVSIALRERGLVSPGRRLGSVPAPPAARSADSPRRSPKAAGSPTCPRGCGEGSAVPAGLRPPRPAQGTGGVAARAVPGPGIGAAGPDRASPPAMRAGGSARANESCRLAKAVATEQRCRAASCGGDGRATLNPQVLCSPVLPGSIRTARPVTPPTGAGPNCKNIKGIFRRTYCAHALLRNGSVFLLPGTPLGHGANRRKDAVPLRNTRVPPAHSWLAALE